MTSTEHPKLAQARGFLAKAESTTFPEEAEACRAKAYELIAKYGIDEHLLHAQERGSHEIVRKDISVAGAYTVQQATLVHSIAKAVGVWSCSTHSTENVARARRGQRVSSDQVTIYGYDNLVELVEILFTSLLLQVTNEREKLTLDDARRAGVRTLRSYRTSWTTGWARKVGERLAAVYSRQVDEHEAQGTSTAVVLADSKAQFQAFGAADLGGKISTTRRRVNTNGFAAGQKAGERADIGQSRVGGQAKALTG